MSEKKDLEENPKVRKFIHSIRNSIHFTEIDLEEMNQFSFDDRMKIFHVYNEMTKYFMDVITYMNAETDDTKTETDDTKTETDDTKNRSKNSSP